MIVHNRVYTCHPIESINIVIWIPNQWNAADIILTGVVWSSKKSNLLSRTGAFVLRVWDVLLVSFTKGTIASFVCRFHSLMGAFIGFTRIDVIDIDVDEIVPISALLFVHEAQDVHHFVNDVKLFKASWMSPERNDVLATPLPADVSGAPFTCPATPYKNTTLTSSPLVSWSVVISFTRLIERDLYTPYKWRNLFDSYDSRTWCTYTFRSRPNLLEWGRLHSRLKMNCN